jgi:LysM repeat protein
MPQPLIMLLLVLALVVPILGAAALRLLEGRIGEGRVVAAAAVMFVLAALSVLVLGRSDVSRLHVAGLTLLLPVVAPSEGEIVLPPGLEEATPAPDPVEATPATGATAPATEQATAAATVAATATTEATAEPPTAEPPTATTEPPTAEPPTATAEPPTATPEPPTAIPAPAGPRSYTVQPGDTLRSIAEQFGVSVAAILEANDLTPAQADALRPGQELVIP